MADQAHAGLAIAVGVQDGFGSPNTTIRGLTGTIDETDGFILGDKNSGDADSGISSPSLDGVFREVAMVAASRTERADSFQKLAVSGFSVTFPMQGNGATSTPTVGEADMATLFPGYEAIYEMIGFIGADGGSGCEHDYTPRHDGSTGGAGADGILVHGSIKCWQGDLSIFFQDVVVSSASVVPEPGGNALITVNFEVGSVPTAYILDGVTFPTLTFGAMEDNAAPVVEGVGFSAFGQVRGFENLTITIENTITPFKDSNVATSGERQVHVRRQFLVSGTLYINTSDSMAAATQLISSSAPSDDLFFQVGTIATAALTIEAFRWDLFNLQPKSIKYNRIGDALVVELTNAKATGTSAGSEAQLTFN